MTVKAKAACLIDVDCQSNYSGHAFCCTNDWCKEDDNSTATCHCNPNWFGEQCGDTMYWTYVVCALIAVGFLVMTASVLMRK